jgi:putative ABC transport system permease protein
LFYSLFRVIAKLEALRGGETLIRALLQDVRYSLRSLRKTRGFFFIAIAILALGIAANTVIFSLLDATLLRYLPYPDAARLMVLHWHNLRGSSGDISWQAFRLLRDRARSLQDVSAIYPLDIGVNLAGVGSPHYAPALRVSAGFFNVLGTLPLAGRSFRPEEEMANGPRAAVLSYGFWYQNFNADLSAIGGTLKINGEDYTIVGIMPRGFRSYPQAEVWLPIQVREFSTDLGNDYRVIARLREDVNEQRAQEELRALSEEYRLQYQPDTSAGANVLVLRPFQDFLVRNVRQNMMILFAAVSFLLLIACTNLALLILVRASARSQEMAIRAALGASRIRLMQTIFSESLVLALCGGIAGIIAAKEFLPFIPRLLPLELPLTTTIGLNKHVLLFAVATSLATCLLVGFAPALRISRVDLNEILKQAPRGSSPSKQHTRMEHIFIGAQAALTLVLVAGAAFFFRSFVALRSIPAGFDVQGVLVAQVSLADQRYATTSQTAQFLERVSEQLKKSSQVDAMAAVNGLPLERGFNLPLFPSDSPQKIEHACEYRPITPAYFQVLRIPVLAGRSFSDGDRSRAVPVAIVNETLARQWWPQGAATGHFVAVAPEYGNPFTDVPRLVVGVTADVHEAGLARPAPPTIFIPIQQTPDKTIAFANKLFLTSILIRGNSPSVTSEQLRAALQSADPNLALAALHPLSEVVTESIAWSRFNAALTTSFGLVALLLATIGFYGLFRYRVVRRTREIGVRMALGASRSGVVTLVIKEGVILVLVGLFVGALSAFLLTRLLATLLYDLKASTTSSVLTAAILLLAVAALTSLSNAIKAASIEPIVVLRSE